MTLTHYSLKMYLYQKVRARNFLWAWSFVRCMDLPDNFLSELEYLDNITSCIKVENYLMLSEYEQNLTKEI